MYCALGLSTEEPTMTTTTTAAADALVPATHPFAGHLRRAAAAEQAAPHRLWAPEDGPLPSLYISHGAPPVFEDTAWMTELHDWARRLPKPKAVLVVSAHWESAPLSITSTDSTRLLALGERLRALREEGVLVVGSGFMTHGLPYIDWQAPDRVPGWSSEFDAWAADALSRGDVEELAHFRTRAPGMPYAHPTVEHFTPLFVTLGAATDPSAPVTTTVGGYFMGLAKRSFEAA
jgi:aromatic ring-opening dioxygenase catalytic subunit (LigB family)